MANLKTIKHSSGATQQIPAGDWNASTQAGIYKEWSLSAPPAAGASIITETPAVDTPAIATPAKITSKMLTEEAETPAIEAAKINQDYLDKVKAVLGDTRYNVNTVANNAFVVGAARAAGVEPNLGLEGKTLGEVISAYDLGGELENYGLQETAKEDDEPIKVPEKKGGSAVDDLYNSLIAQKQEGMQESVDMDEYMKKKQAAATAVETARQAIADKKLLDAVAMDEIGKGDKPISMTLINRDRTKYSQDEYITNLKMGMDYNNKLILAKMAEGNFMEAQRINKEIANDNYEIQKLQLDQLMYQDKIKADEYDRMEREVAWERKLSLEYKYTYIPDREIYDDIVKKYQISPANFDNFIYKEGDRMYLKNLEEMSEIEMYEAKKKIDAQYKTGKGGGGVGIFDADFEGAANAIMALENASASSPEAYWGVVKGLSEDLGLPEESIDKMLMQKIQSMKGEQPTGQPQPIFEENIASDFEIPEQKGEYGGYINEKGEFIAYNEEAQFMSDIEKFKAKGKGLINK